LEEEPTTAPRTPLARRPDQGPSLVRATPTSMARGQRVLVGMLFFISAQHHTNHFSTFTQPLTIVPLVGRTPVPQSDRIAPSQALEPTPALASQDIPEMDRLALVCVSLFLSFPC